MTQRRMFLVVSVMVEGVRTLGGVGGGGLYSCKFDRITVGGVCDGEGRKGIGRIARGEWC